MRHVLLIALMSSTLAFAEELPKEISGRWVWESRRVSQTFSLENIRLGEGQAFTADLTWWAVDPKCTLRNQPITGERTQTGLKFSATTKCDVAFTVDLQRADGGWRGQAVTTRPAGVTLDLTAK